MTKTKIITRIKSWGVYDGIKQELIFKNLGRKEARKLIQTMNRLDSQNRKTVRLVPICEVITLESMP